MYVQAMVIFTVLYNFPWAIAKEMKEWSMDRGLDSSNISTKANQNTLTN